MPKIAYINKKIGTSRLNTINTANTIIAEYQSQGFRLTLRQLYYQFVSRDLIANNQQSYSLLGDIINDGRLVGLIDWYAIEDRTRSLKGINHWESPSAIVSAVAQQFAIDKWETQHTRVEVWIEKDALAGVAAGICNELDVPYFSCRGYTSQSEMWAGAMRLKAHLENGQNTLILHFGDHDPSGKDMTRDIEERLEMFMGGTELRRMALNMDQIDEYQPPPNPAKLTNSRAQAYIAEFGPESWELDALEPSVIVNLIREAVESVRDEIAWDEAVDKENAHKDTLQKVSDQWRSVVRLVTDLEVDFETDGLEWWKAQNRY